MRAIGMIQARMGGTRLPGKVLANVQGKPMLQRMMERVKVARAIEECIVITPDTAENDPIIDLCHQQGWLTYRGDEDDVLDRYVMAAKAYDANPIVRMTADCPLIDPGVINAAVDHWYMETERTGRPTYVANNIEKTFPHGLDVECMSYQMLKHADAETTRPRDREHVTLYMRREPKRYNLVNLRCPRDLHHWRLTVDYAADLDRVRQIFFAFKGQKFFSTRDVLWFLERRPDLWTREERDAMEEAS